MPTSGHWWANSQPAHHRDILGGSGRRRAEVEKGTARPPPHWPRGSWVLREHRHPDRPTTQWLRGAPERRLAFTHKAYYFTTTIARKSRRFCVQRGVQFCVQSCVQLVVGE